MSSRSNITSIIFALTLIASASAFTPIKCDAGDYADTSGSYCMIAPGGSFTATAGDSLSVCPVGTFSDWGSTNCTKCSAETISPAGASTCTASSVWSLTISQDTYGLGVACPAGTFFTPTGCQGCAAGFASSAINATQCTICPKNSFSIGNQAQCTACAAGSTTSWSGASKCDNGNPYPYIFSCPTGFGMAPSKRVCQICPMGTYSDAASFTCTTCASQSYTQQAGSSSCFKFIPYIYTPSAEELARELNVATSTSTGISSSSTTTTSTTSTASQSSSLPPGVKLVQSFSTTCSGASACRPGFGFFAYSCGVCKAGYYSKGGISKCKLCAVGTTTHSPGQSACV